LPQSHIGARYRSLAAAAHRALTAAE